MNRNALSAHLLLHVGLGCGLMLVVMGAWYSGGVFSPRMAWLIAIPLVAFYCISERAGLIWFALVLFCELVMGAATWQSWVPEYLKLDATEMTLSFASHAVVILVAIGLGFLSVHVFQETFRTQKLRQQELEARRQKLMQTAVQRAQFVSAISEKLRTPMENILSLNDQLMAQVMAQVTAQVTEQVKANEVSDASSNNNINHDKALKVLNHTRKSADHLLTVISDLVDSDDVESGKIDVHCETFVLRDTIYTAFELFRPRMKALGLNYHCEIDEGVPHWVWAGRHRLMQVLVNLLGNAVKFTAQGEVRLCVEKVDAGVKFSIQDTGIGIAPEQRALLFQRFSQADDNIQSNFGGHGLGLFITQRLIDVMGGEMGLESELGKGSTFWFTLPLIAANQPS